jgi:hypothetical protein
MPSSKHTQHRSDPTRPDIIPDPALPFVSSTAFSSPGRRRPGKKRVGRRRGGAAGAGVVVGEEEGGAERGQVGEEEVVERVDEEGWMDEEGGRVRDLCEVDEEGEKMNLRKIGVVREWDTTVVSGRTVRDEDVVASDCWEGEKEDGGDARCRR